MGFSDHAMMRNFKMNGEFQQDSLMMKLCRAVCALTVLALSLILFIGFYSLADRASALNTSQDPMGLDIVKPYDLCDTTLLTLPLVDLGLESSFGALDEWTSIALDSFDELADAVDE